MDERDRAQLWKFTAIGIIAMVATAVITGLVVANRTTPGASVVAQTPTAPSTTTPSTTAPGATQSPTVPPAVAPAPRHTGVPPQEIVSACNRQAVAQAGSAPRAGTDKVLDVGKDAGVGALGGAAVGAAGGAIAGGGKGAGKGALIGGLVGAGGGTLYGMWDNKKNDERFSAAYASCMHARGYTG